MSFDGYYKFGEICRPFYNRLMYLSRFWEELIFVIYSLRLVVSSNPYRSKDSFSLF